MFRTGGRTAHRGAASNGPTMRLLLDNLGYFWKGYNGFHDVFEMGWDGVRPCVRGRPVGGIKVDKLPS